MIEYLKDYKEDALKITDAQIAADWHLGLVRAVGKVVAGGAYPQDSMGSYGSTIAGSNREHVMGNWGNIPRCPLVEIYEPSEEGGEEYHFSSFGGSTSNVIVLRAKATCQCGRLVKHPVSMNVAPDELIYNVMHADD
jgi:hypothetical protein